MDRVTAIYDGKVLILQQSVEWAEGQVVGGNPQRSSMEPASMTPDEAWERLKGNPRRLGGEEFYRGDLYR